MTLIRMNTLILESSLCYSIPKKHSCESREGALMRLIRSLMSDGPPPITWAIIPFSSTQGIKLCRVVPAFCEDVAAAGND